MRLLLEALSVRLLLPWLLAAGAAALGAETTEVVEWLLAGGRLLLLLLRLLLFALEPFALSLPLLKLVRLAFTDDCCCDDGACALPAVRLALQFDEDDAADEPKPDEPCDDEPLAVVETGGELGMRDDAG